MDNLWLALLVFVAFTLETGCASIEPRHPSQTTEGERMLKRVQLAKPISPVARREAAYYLHSMRRVLHGKVETERERELAAKLSKLDATTVAKWRERIDAFASLPLRLQGKLVDRVFWRTPLDTSIRALSSIEAGAETEGVVCGAQQGNTCTPHEEVGSLALPRGAEALAIGKNTAIALVALGDAGIGVIDVSNPAHPIFFTDPPVLLKSASTAYTNDVKSLSTGSGRLFVVSSTRSGSLPGAIEIFDLSIPTAPVFQGSLTGPAFRLAISEDEKWAFTYDPEAQIIRIVDISLPTSPVERFTLPDTTGVAGLSFGGGVLQVLRPSGNSTFFSFSDAPSPSLAWFSSDPSGGCMSAVTDSMGGVRSTDGRILIAREGDLHSLDLTAGPGVVAGAAKNCEDGNRNAIAVADSGVIVTDIRTKRQVRDVGDTNKDCWDTALEFFDYPVFPNSAPLSAIGNIEVPNEISGIEIKAGAIYTVDREETKAVCKVSGDVVRLRIWTSPHLVLQSADLKPTIETVNGSSSPASLPAISCGGSYGLCTQHSECGSSGYCRGGLCEQPPAIEVSSGSDLVLTGTNYWDKNAQVLIQNYGSTSWIPFDAHVNGDEFCDAVDKMSVTLDGSVTAPGIKTIKIRNYNTASPKKHTCTVCADPDSATCTPAFVDSDERIVYLGNPGTLASSGFAMTVIEVKAIGGTDGWGDLGPHEWYDDEVSLKTSSPLDVSQFVMTDDMVFKQNGSSRPIAGIEIESRDTASDDSLFTPGIELIENDDNRAVGATLITAGVTCAGIVASTGQHPAIYIGCGAAIAVGVILVAFSGVDVFVVDGDFGLGMSKLRAEQFLSQGRCALPPEMEGDNKISISKISAVGDLVLEGGYRTRTFTKEYRPSNSDHDANPDSTVYSITYRIIERR